MKKNLISLLLSAVVLMSACTKIESPSMGNLGSGSSLPLGFGGAKTTCKDNPSQPQQTGKVTRDEALCGKHHKDHLKPANKGSL